MRLRALAVVCGALTFGGVAAFAVATPAAADGFVMTIDPLHGVPGAALTATITPFSGCEAGTVTVTGTYIDISGEEATTDPVTATNGATYTAALVLPGDAARSSLTDEDVNYTATLTCPAPEAPAMKGALVAADATSNVVGVTVDDLAGAVVTVNPDNALRGATVDFTVEDCVGGIAELFFIDAEDNDFDVDPADVTLRNAGESLAGTFTIPGSAALGGGGIVAECTQAGTGAAALAVLDADVVSTAGGGAPAVPPVVAVPRFTG